MARPRRGAGSPPPDELRCHRNDGRTWRCSEPRFHDKIYCRHHFLSLEARMAAAAAAAAAEGSSSKKHKTPPTVARKSATKATNVAIVSAKAARVLGTGRLKAPKTTAKVRRGSFCKELAMPTKTFPSAEGKKDGAGGDGGDVDTSSVGGVFEVGQVWAIPHEVCGFPLAYARIERIGPTEGTVEVSQLEHHPTTEDERRWADDGIPLACGLFRVSESSSTMVMDLADLSHLVVFHDELHDKVDVLRTFYRIFPRKGDIWAVYHKWDEREKGFVRKLVEIVSGFNEEEGEVTVAALTLVDGTDAVFQRQSVDGFDLLRTFSRSELLRLSHQVPAFKILSGRKDCRRRERWKVMFK